MDNPVSNEYRQVPQDIDAERAVLGAIFFDVKSENAMIEASAILAPDDFYRQANQTIFKAMQSLVEDNRPIDMLTLQDKLNSMQQLDNVGGMPYLAEISESTASAANLKHYANIVREKAILRKMIDTLTRSMSLAYDAAEPSEELLDQLSRSIDTIAENRGSEDFRKIKDVIREYQANLDEAVKNDSDVVGLSTGFPEMDKITHGFRNDQMIVFGARPAVGKTAFVLNIARNVAKNEQVPVVIFEMEMSATDIVGRLLAGEGSIDSNHLTTGQMTQEDWQALTLAMQSLAQMQIYMDDTAGIKINQISAKLHQLERDLLNEMSPEDRVLNPHPIGLVVIDYLGLIESNNTESRQQAVSEVSRSIKKLAKELSTPIIALAQLSRGVEQRTDKRPILSDLRDSGSIEQDADIVAFLYRDDYSRDDGEDGEGDPREEQEAVPIEVIFEKNRAGARGTATLMFNKPTFKFNAMAPLYRDDMNAGVPDMSSGW
ncbi:MULTISPECIES: replicative DNA helicase [Leuconostoc]|jgi:replicative DNA helicase|uniref:replicative DNA helicase n=1 Tax=Leuconostoc TaxID=1243 RepID=UPI0011DCDD71|nr:MULTISPECIES: replicative DNA helicase [Leuconostoc]MBK0040412.1 replicative DNA helicase [Leuconostoc sp. S51]MBK0051318.1 replicative DNA helicase [Leuconostoc sp. S50]MBS0958457.1 replicative DNA helicase [Leuconostoc pseudomesenteroides]MCT4379693.1 replicative DNA helicase [Leuconostoc pseudomesenteroides]MCT4414133.1 replicative DNA helicase [Leuconostoc pseudomesenteroides]